MTDDANNPDVAPVAADGTPFLFKKGDRVVMTGDLGVIWVIENILTHARDGQDCYIVANVADNADWYQINKDGFESPGHTTLVNPDTVVLTPPDGSQPH